MLPRLRPFGDRKTNFRSIIYGHSPTNPANLAKIGTVDSWSDRSHIHPFNGPFFRVSRYQKGKTNLECTEARVSEWQWQQLDHMQVCTSLQTDNHASTPPLSFLQAGCPFCRPTNSVKALKALTGNVLKHKIRNSSRTCSRQACFRQPGRAKKSSVDVCIHAAVCCLSRSLSGRS